ncbi:MAG: nickel-binding protein [Ferruginibacter sp.]
MPIFMDLHIVPGVNSKEVAEAHSRDVYLEKDHHCKCITYWVDELRGHVFCLIDAPNKDSVNELHSRSHGLVPHKIIEVQSDFVESFLGRITDPDSGQYTDSGLLILDDTSYRIIMRINIPDAILLQHQIGKEDSVKKVEAQDTIIRQAIQKHSGKEAIYNGSEFIGSFITADKAVNCALAIQQQLNNVLGGGFSISIHAGEPVAQNDALFGDTLQVLQSLLLLNRSSGIIITDSVKALIAKDILHKNASNLLMLTIADEQFLLALLEVLENNFNDTEFNADKFSQALAMSKSQLYRKITGLTNYTPNELLNQFRLEKGKSLLRKKQFNIAEVTFTSGFSSPSYFTKSFKSKFGLLPLAYQALG